jgi:hypothetical protein
MPTRSNKHSFLENPAFNRLDAELVRPIPNFKSIEKALYEVPPVLVSQAI